MKYCIHNFLITIPPAQHVLNISELYAEWGAGHFSKKLNPIRGETAIGNMGNKSLDNAFIFSSNNCN
jgi:hypothetical protein